MEQDQPPSQERSRRGGAATRWMVRLAFSFCILALVLGYEGWKAYSGGQETQAALLWGGAAAGAALGALGLLLRHSPR